MSAAVLAEHITSLVPADWHVVGVERDIDEPAGVNVIIKLSDIERLAEAPRSGRYRAVWTITVVQPHADPEQADPAVYDACLALVDALDSGPGWLTWRTARKVLEAGRYAFDITVETITKRRENPDA